MSAVFLLDTHALLWWMSNAPELSVRAKEIILDTEHTILVSAATLWEISIKQRRGTLTGCGEYLETYDTWHRSWGFATLDIAPGHAVRAGLLPIGHTDPFDRMLIAQSVERGATLVTRDRAIRAVHPNCTW